MQTIKVPRIYAQPDDRQAWKSLFVSVAIVVLGLGIPSVHAGSWLALFFGALFFAVGILRLYSIQHDCGHYSYFTDRGLNDRAGGCMSVFSGIAHSVLRYNHNLHHAHLGDLSHRDAHEVFVMTRQEYECAPVARKMLYRLYRHPVTLFLIGPLLIYFLRYRWPRNTSKVSIRDVILQNLAMFCFWALVVALLGWWSFYALLLGSFIAGSFGIFVVYVGHNFEETYWRGQERRDARMVALHGASSLRLGRVVDFVLLNFGYHDLHHFNTKIPCYNLKRCNAAIADDWNRAVIGPADAIQSLRWRLWDEASERMIPFPQTLLQELLPEFRRYC